MAKGDWKVLEHGPLQRLAENLWRIEGALPGMSLRRTMTVVKRSNNELVVHSAIALDEKTQRELEALGTMAWMVVPNAYHRLDAPAYKTRYPSLKVIGPPGSRKKIEQVIALDGTFEIFPSDETVRFESLHGVGDTEAAMIVRSSDGTTIVLTDSVFNMDKKKDFLGWFFTTLLGSAPGPRISRLAKMAFIKDQPALRADLLRFAAVPDLVRFIVAHEKVAHGPEAKAALEKAATYLR